MRAGFLHSNEPQKDGAARGQLALTPALSPQGEGAELPPRFPSKAQGKRTVRRSNPATLKNAPCLTRERDSPSREYLHPADGLLPNAARRAALPRSRRRVISHRRASPAPQSHRHRGARTWRRPRNPSSPIASAGVAAQPGVPRGLGADRTKFAAILDGRRLDLAEFTADNAKQELPIPIVKCVICGALRNGRRSLGCGQLPSKCCRGSTDDEASLTEADMPGNG